MTRARQALINDDFRRRAIFTTVGGGKDFFSREETRFNGWRLVGGMVVQKDPPMRGKSRIHERRKQK